MVFENENVKQNKILKKSSVKKAAASQHSKRNYTSSWNSNLHPGSTINASPSNKTIVLTFIWNIFRCKYDQVCCTERHCCLTSNWYKFNTRRILLKKRKKKKKKNGRYINMMHADNYIEESPYNAFG